MSWWRDADCFGPFRNHFDPLDSLGILGVLDILDFGLLIFLGPSQGSSVAKGGHSHPIPGVCHPSDSFPSDLVDLLIFGCLNVLKDYPFSSAVENAKPVRFHTLSSGSCSWFSK